MKNWLNDVLGNPEERKPATSTTAKKDIPVSKPVPKPVKTPEPEAKSVSQAEPAKPKSQGEIPKIHGEPEKAKTQENQKNPGASPSKEDLKKALEAKEEISAKMSVNVPVRKVFGAMSFEDKMRLIIGDSEAEKIVTEILRRAVEQTPDALLDAFGERLLAVAMSCDDLRARLVDAIAENDEWTNAFCEACSSEEELSDDEIRELADEVLDDENATKIFVKAFLDSPRGRDAIYDGIRNS